MSGCHYDGAQTASVTLRTKHYQIVAFFVEGFIESLSPNFLEFVVTSRALCSELSGGFGLRFRRI